MKPRKNITAWLALALAVASACTQGNEDYQVAVDSRPADLGGVGVDPPPADAAWWGDTRAHPDADDPVDGGETDAVVPVDAGVPDDSGLPVEAAGPADTTAPADTTVPVDMAPAGDAAGGADATGGTGDTGAPLVNGLRAVYYAGRDHNTQLFERTDQTINFNWAHESPDPRVPVDDFSVRWFARIQPRYTERYTLSIVSDDGARLMVNGQYLVDKWVSQSSVENSAQIDLVAGQLYDIQVDYFDRQLTALVRFYWTSRTQAKEIVPYSRLFIR